MTTITNLNSEDMIQAVGKLVRLKVTPNKGRIRTSVELVLDETSPRFTSTLESRLELAKPSMSIGVLSAYSETSEAYGFLFEDPKSTAFQMESYYDWTVEIFDA